MIGGEGSSNLYCLSYKFVIFFVFNNLIKSCAFSILKWLLSEVKVEDTDLSLRVLKDGLCTIQFNAFLCGKVTTQRMRGGNSNEFYDNEGTFPKSKMIEDLHPDVAKVVWKFNRWHHHVDYSHFKINKLVVKKKDEEKDYMLYKVKL